MNGFHWMVVICHLGIPAYSIWKLCGYLLPLVISTHLELLFICIHKSDCLTLSLSGAQTYDLRNNAHDCSMLDRSIQNTLLAFKMYLV